MLNCKWDQPYTKDNDFFYHINLLYTSVAPLLLQTTFVPIFNLFKQVNSILINKVQVYWDYFVHLVPEYFDKRLFKNILFTLIVFTEYHKWCFQNTYKEIPWQKIKIYKYLFVLQILSAKFNENFFVNMLGVWTASIFVELYEDSSSLYVCFIIYRKM